MAEQLKGKRIAALVANGFEQVELLEPRKALEGEGAVVDVVSPEPGRVRGWNHREWGEEVPVDRALDQACPEDYDALLLPGGVMNPDRLRTNPQAVQLVKLFFDSGKPIAVICHGPWTLIEADVVRGVKMTSYPSVKTDLQNAGAHWVDEEVVVDQGIVSSRRPADLPAFNRRMIEAFDEGLLGPHARQPRTRPEEKGVGIAIPPLPAPVASAAVVLTP
jgi:protease I